MNLLAVVLTVLCFKVSQGAAEFCELTVGGRSFCIFGCCGINIITCCGSRREVETKTTTEYSFWNTGVIVGFAISGIVCLCVLIALITRCVKASASLDARGAFVQQTKNQPRVFVMSTAKQKHYSVRQQPVPGKSQTYPGPVPRSAPSPGAGSYPTESGCTNTTNSPLYAGISSTLGSEVNTNPGEAPTVAPCPVSSASPS